MRNEDSKPETVHKEREHKDDELFSNPMQRGFERILTPFQEFIRDTTTASVFLLICTIAALLIANSPLSADYSALLHTRIGVTVNGVGFSKDLHHWINDGLMALFFFVIGLEIKRELLAGELQNVRLAVPVLAAAVGGMIVPALIYAGLNAGTASESGWGIPVATDTAFALGILALLGRRVPAALAAFLTALAIIDDIGAVLVIAVFYSDAISVPHLMLAFLFLSGLVFLNLLGVRHAFPYLLGGGLVWLAMLESGVHATVAGVLVAFTVPARPRRGPSWFLGRARRLMDRFENLEQGKARRGQADAGILAAEDQHAVVERIQETAHEVTTPLQLWVRTLEGPVALLILPVFALANAGVPVKLSALPALLADPITLGIVLGLVVGKAVGITAFCWLAVKAGVGELSAAMNFRHVIGIGLLGGMGFTMSIFIAGLNFETSPGQLLTAKSAILLASLIAGIVGYLWLNTVAPRRYDAAGKSFRHAG
ncbi:MAG: Na+/H+ antiporter NhaA [Gammaproteobacteria bacterium]|jgi:NhaA family Na+:H+ antiporter